MERQETLFLNRAYACFAVILQQLEAISCADYEDSQDAISIKTMQGRTYLLNIHKGMQQIWISSPLSGGNHFNYFPTPQEDLWINSRTGEKMGDLMESELTRLIGQPFVLPMIPPAFVH